MHIRTSAKERKTTNSKVESMVDSKLETDDKSSSPDHPDVRMSEITWISEADAREKSSKYSEQPSMVTPD